MDEGPPNPLANGACLAQTFFCWLLPFFKYGYKNTLELPDLHRICPEDSASLLADRLQKNWQKQLEISENSHRKPSLTKALIKTFWRPAAVSGIIVFFEECVFKLLQPIALSFLVTYFSPEPGITTLQAYLCMVGLALCGILATTAHHPYFFRMSRLGMQVRIATSTLIFRKSLRLSNAALGQTTVGKLVNILSSDVNRFDLMMLFLHYLWVGPTQLTILLIILYRSMGPSCLVGFVILICLAPLQGWMGKLFSKFRIETASLTDERVRIMNEIISGMRIIKIHAWEFPFAELVKKARRKEIGKILHSTYLRAFNLAFFNMATALISFSTFTVYAFSGHVLTPGIIFLAIPLFHSVRLTVVLFIPFCIMYGSEGLIAIRRIQDFLMMEELKSLKLSRSLSLSSIASDANLPVAEQIGEPLDERTDDEGIIVKEEGIEMKEKGMEDTEKETDKMEPEQELEVEPVPDGNLDVEFLPKNDREQDSNQRRNSERQSEKEAEDSVEEKENKCDGEVFQNCRTRLREREDHTLIIRNLQGSWEAKNSEGGGFEMRNISLTVKAGELVAVIGPVGSGKSSLLLAIMNELPMQTGELLLSGSLAYTAQQPWVFSGTLRDNILFGHKFEPDRYKKVLIACALKTDISLFPDGDLTMVGDRGITLSGGQRARVSLARAVYHDADVYLLDDPLSAVDTAVGRHLFDRCIKHALRTKPVLLVTHQLQYLDAADRIIVLKEGEMVANGSYEELQRSGIDFASLLKEYEDKTLPKETLSRTSSLRSIPGSIATEISVCHDEIILEADERGSQRLKETKEAGSVNLQVYVKFFKAGVGFLGFMIFMIFNCSSQAFLALTDWWLSQWAFAEETACAELFNGSCNVNFVEPDHELVESLYIDRRYYVQLLSIFLVCFVILSLIRTYHLFFIIINAANTLHNQMFSAVILAPMRFFDTNPIGRILNRFSKDIGFIDEILPTTFCDFNTISIQTVAVVITIGILNPVVFIFTVPLCLVFISVRRYYLASSRDIKRMEGVTRSPIFSHLSATLQGLVTIRAFGVQQDFVRQFDRHQNTHTKSWFLFLSTTRWFGIAMDWISVLFLSLVALCCLLSADLFDLNSALVGLSLSYSLTLMGAFQWGVRQSAEIENLMTSAERVLEYTRLESEAALEADPEPDADWPKHGIITFEKVSLAYTKDGPLVLKGLNCCIRAQEKVGVVGRTGAGKSSLMGALMRLTEPKGILKIDGVDITQIGLHILRKRVSFIPQDPVLFSGTLRKNLDPFSEHSDEDMWSALEEVQLKSIVDESPEKLEMRMSEGGTNFSVGQRQLVCLARAVLHRNKILIVDEATANVDPRTDQLIQETIRKKFRQCTVLTIAHRLNTIIDLDRVLVLEQGQIAEFDEPYVLLKNEDSLFLTMVQETGKSEAAKLTQVARTRYYDNNPSNPYGFDSNHCPADAGE